MNQLESRRAYTRERTIALQSELNSARTLLDGKACVYATGSFGRLEANQNSDLDLFIVGRNKDDSGANSVRLSQLSRLDEICIKADLIESTRKLIIPDFDGDGKYLVHYSSGELINTLGMPEDDANNTLTGRLLLFLESRPLLGEETYNYVIDEVIAAYWRDYEDHKGEFMPAFLANDILRLWRTFCVNYEARTERKPDEKKIKGKIKNYKLKHSRMLTCYSALLYLLAIYKRENTVSPKDASEMTRLTPSERLEWLLVQRDLSEASGEVRSLINQYNKFLGDTDFDEDTLKEKFMNPEQSKRYMKESYRFGDLMFEALSKIGRGNRFFRLLTV
ncbi:nucleotidyltransferase domain-containing protein [Labrys monachus]|uniref:Nucleotidyltransferase n=1 Tax=Labrys monachus TaxID=217067 RepID=A0ABU0FMJ2_9HYPH|nr:nucleotidyltransferase domain-containing protein [Labrys monachus]MDQ0395833.1 putative nucleotidyltransferase [Labrys monachus]